MGGAAGREGRGGEKSHQSKCGPGGGIGGGRGGEKVKKKKKKDSGPFLTLCSFAHLFICYVVTFPPPLSPLLACYSTHTSSHHTHIHPHACTYVHIFPFIDVGRVAHGLDVFLLLFHNIFYFSSFFLHERNTLSLILLSILRTAGA